MSEPEYTHCKSCHRKIFFAITRKGKRMPIDAAAHPEGNVVTYWSQGKVRAEKYDGRRWRDVIRRTCHFQTCPSAAAHRTRRAA